MTLRTRGLHLHTPSTTTTMSWTALCASGWVLFRLSSGLVFDDDGCGRLTASGPQFDDEVGSICTMTNRRVLVHPHVCGEIDAPAQAACHGRCGSPPRVWGNRFQQRNPVRHVRFTPTCVGKSPGRPMSFVQQFGSPPRVWGNRRRRCCDTRDARRFTPTCVGKSASRSVARAHSMPGSPPRVWGNRIRERMAPIRITVHPHVCGEICFGLEAIPLAAAGSPPRVWGNRVHAIGDAGLERFTPTCVGKSRRIGRRPTHRRFTPTCVGKSSEHGSMHATYIGSPPRVWGNHARAGVSDSGARFTPTCVGKSRR